MASLIGYYMKTKNQERMKLIEKGQNPDEGMNLDEYRKQSSLRNGILLLFFGLGIFIGQWLVRRYSGLDDILMIMTMILIFGGIGFIINFIIMKNWSKK